MPNSTAATSWSSPQTTAAVRRSSYLSDAIRQMGQQDKAIYNTAGGTNMNVLANAILGFSRNQAESEADASLAADKAALADAIRDQFPDPVTTGGAMDLTPGSVAQTSEQLGKTANNAQYGDLAAFVLNATGDPTAALNAGYARQRHDIDDKRYEDERDYTRTRDNRVYQFGVDRAAKSDEQWQSGFDFGKERAGIQDTQWGATFNEDKRQFDAKLAADQAAAAAALQAKREENQAKRDGSAMFEGPQLASVYIKSMDALDDAKKAQGMYDTISNASQQFLDGTKPRPGGNAKGYWAQGEGIVNDIAQMLSMETTDLKALTNRIAPLMREAGSGSSSDKDLETFKSAVVSINNTPEANQRIAAGAKAIATRNQQYIEFLTDAIDPQDPRSRQTADRIWNAYKNDQRLFDDKSGQVLPAQPFRDWFAEHTAPEASSSASPPPRISTAAERDALPTGAAYTAPDGSVKVKK